VLIWPGLVTKSGFFYWMTCFCRGVPGTKKPQFFG
jgi:hypothetical protein